MFEGKHIHFSPTDNKPLCSYSGKLCRQRRLNGYAFCIRHILEDKSAPFKQCSYVTRNNSQKCLNAIPTSQDRGYCHSHMQVVGIIPKTERKSKVNSANKHDTHNGSSTTDKFPGLSGGNIKKDPGSVFKFEEESSDVTDVFSYKNGLSTGTLNGKGKSAKLRDTGYNSSKDGKNVKSHNGFSNNNPTANFTTKKITDKNKNVYTAIIPTNICMNNSQNKVYSKSKSTCWNNATTDATSPSTVVGSRTLKPITRIAESELNPHASEEIRQFEQLKTLKQLDKSLLQSSGGSFPILKDGTCGDAKLRVFPRLAVATNKIKSDTSSSSSTPQASPTSSLLVTNHLAPDDSSSQSSTPNNSKSEIVSTSSSPPLITRSNNSIIIKTEPQQLAVAASPKNEPGIDNAGDRKSESITNQHTNSSDRGVLFTTSGSNNNCSNPNSLNSNDHSISIDKELKNRHEFLAHVRHSFKSQYKSIKKACKFSERCERSGKKKLRDSIMRCVRIDAGICAQVLLGDGLKLPTLTSPVKIEVVEGKIEPEKQREYDDYDFVDNEGSSLPIIKNDTAVSDQKYKKGKPSSKSSSRSSSNNNKTNHKRSTKKGKELEILYSPQASDNNVEKKENEKVIAEFAKESKSKGVSPTTTAKRKLKRADALLVSPENSLGSGGIHLNENTVSLNISNAERVDGSIVKKQRLELSEMTALETDLALSLNDQSSPSHDGRIASSAHTNLNHSVGHGINDTQNELHDILGHSQLSSSVSSHRNQGLETVLNSVGSSENAGTPDGVITDASFDSTFEHSTSSQPDCEFSEDDLEHSFELQIDPEIESQASRLLEDNVLTEADFTELFPDNRMSDHKFGRNDLQELGMTGLEFDVNDIDYSLFANIFPNFPRSSQPESISISNQF